MLKSTLICLLLAASLSAFGAEPNKPKWQIAKEILDEHFDDDSVLKEAAKVLIAAKSETPNDPNLFVQAARLTIKGGEGFAPALQRGTVQAYASLLDQALKIDPNHKKALILRAEAYSLAGDLARERSTLQQALRTQGIDRWLQVGLARHADSVRDSSSAFASYEEIEKLGPGDTQDQRNAYVLALSQIARFRPLPGEDPRLKELAQLARKYRSPRDYRSPAAFDQEFLFHGYYTEAVEHARESTKVRPTRNARVLLASGLYGEAALQAADGRQADAKRKAIEARSFGFSREVILDRLRGPSPNFAKALPNLDPLLD